MSIEAVARGLVADEPVTVSTDSGSATVLVIRCDSDQFVEYEVTCRDARLGELVSDRVTVGDQVVVIGRVELRAVHGPIEDPASAARVSIEASTVALDLGALSQV